MSGIWEHLDRIIDTGVVIAPAFWWLARWIRRIGITAAFTKEVATVHLPHIYTRQKRHDEQLGIEVADHPNIGYVNGTPPAARIP